MGRMMHYGWSCGPFAMIGGPWGWILNVLLWGLLIAGVIWLGKTLLGRSRAAPAREPHLDTLKRRYAAGEVNREDFERMRCDLEA